MKIQTICAISVIFLLSLNISVARAADGEVKCAAVLDIEIDEKKGEMEYHANLLISNSSNENIIYCFINSLFCVCILLCW